MNRLRTIEHLYSFSHWGNPSVSTPVQGTESLDTVRNHHHQHHYHHHFHQWKINIRIHTYFSTNPEKATSSSEHSKQHQKAASGHRRSELFTKVYCQVRLELLQLLFIYSIEPPALDPLLCLNRWYYLSSNTRRSSPDGDRFGSHNFRNPQFGRRQSRSSSSERWDQFQVLYNFVCENRKRLKWKSTSLRVFGVQSAFVVPFWCDSWADCNSVTAFEKGLTVFVKNVFLCRGSIRNGKSSSFRMWGLHALLSLF